MKKYILLIVLAVLLVAAIFFGIYLLQQLNQEKARQADEAAIRDVVANFGYALKSVSLLSPTAEEDIEQNYKSFLSPDLIGEWKKDPSKAAGRIVSSPWPDRISIISIEQFGSGAYDVKGRIIEITSLEEEQGGFAAMWPIDLGVVNFDGRWLITGVSVGEYENGDEGYDLIFEGTVIEKEANCGDNRYGSMAKINKIISVDQRFTDTIKPGDEIAFPYTSPLNLLGNEILLIKCKGDIMCVDFPKPDGRSSYWNCTHVLG